MSSLERRPASPPVARVATGLEDSRPRLGRAGEEAAVRYLEQRGYRIAARNVRIGRTELDLVARRGHDIVFCEVKTRRGGRMGAPEEAVTVRKQVRILRAAEAYLARHPARGGVRFDVLALTEPAPGDFVVRHIEGAFRPW